MEECQTCYELSSELVPVEISEIRIAGAGYYNFRREILYCPTCGKLIQYGKNRVIKDERSKEN